MRGCRLLLTQTILLWALNSDIWSDIAGHSFINDNVVILAESFGPKTSEKYKASSKVNVFT